MKLSVCVPVYNGASTVGPLVDEIANHLGHLDYEVILVNDGSPRDDSEVVCARLAEARKEVRFLGLRRNFGEHSAVMCALAHSLGEYAVIVDDDFQNPPSEILKLLEKAEEGYDVVYTHFAAKKHHWFRNLGSRFNDRVATWLLEKPRDLYLSSFKLLSRDLVQWIVRYTGPFPYIDGLILRTTSSITSVQVEHNDRKEGTSNYTLKKLMGLWLRMFVNFSQKPLRVAMSFGMFLAVVSILMAIYFFVEKVIHPDSSYGWASLIVAVLFMGGTQLIFLGLLGEYIGKIYLDINGTPQWTLKQKID